MLFNSDGDVMLPLVSVPRAKAARPSAELTADPDEEPDGS